MPELREVLFGPEVVEKLWIVHGLTNGMWRRSSSIPIQSRDGTSTPNMAGE